MGVAPAVAIVFSVEDHKRFSLPQHCSATLNASISQDAVLVSGADLIPTRR